MIYLYAYTNHKSNLDSLRRVVAIYDALKKENLECEILLNEYRAQLLLKEWGLPLGTTIETIKDIDAVAKKDDIIVIDSPEEIEGKVVTYPQKFKGVIYINSLCKVVDFIGANVINIALDKKPIFRELNSSQKKEPKSIFIYGDSDPDKTILKNSEIFKNKNLDLYWGIYFYVKYEDDLAKIFNEIKESEEYYEILSQYQNIYTSSLQVAIEAKANNAFVEFLELKELERCHRELLESLNINIVKDITSTNTTKFQIEKLNNFDYEIINIIKTYV